MMLGKPVAVAAAILSLAACGGGGGSASQGGGNGPIPDTIVLGDALIYASGQLSRVEASCNGTLCTVSFQGESETIDLRNVDPDGPHVTITGERSRNGVRIGRATASSDGFNFNTLGVWGVHNAGLPLVGSTTIQGVGIRFAMPMSLGDGSGSNPLTGSATWTGAMTGVKVGSSSLGAEVTGDAALTADLGAATLDLAFTNIAEWGSDVPSADIRWQGVPMQDGAFQSNGLDGRFYGPGHEEAGGVFERNGIAGAFSLARQ